MHRKFLAIFMTVCLVAALFAGCGGKDKGDSSTKPDISSPSTQENGTAADANAVIPGETQHADGQGGTEQTANGSGSNTANTPGGGSNGTTGKNSGSGQTTTKKSSGGSATTTTKPSGGGSSDRNSKAEIVSYFNTAANKVKTGKPGLKYEMTFSMNVLGESVSPDREGDTLPKGSNLNNIFPVSGKTWSSQLSASAVKSASRTLKDGKYTIKIVLNDEKNVTNINNCVHGKVFTCLDTSALLDMAKDVGMEMKNISNSYSDSSVTCVVDAKTGNMLSASYLLNDKISATIQYEGMTLPTDITLVVRSDFNMSW